jgi:flavin reductase (DIM6/NTAB) family NADH-FMN oxidoreductase RutF
MPAQLRTIEPAQLRQSPFKLIGDDWMLITAGPVKKWNTMTASWGGLGVLWNRPVAFVFVRPTRHTWGFIEANPRFTLSFFAEKWRPALTLCGTRSGRDTDKAKATGLVPFAPAPGCTSFEQARLILCCRKLYTTDIDPARFLDPGLDRNYPKKDYHRVYVGEIRLALSR